MILQTVLATKHSNTCVSLANISGHTVVRICENHFRRQLTTATRDQTVQSSSGSYSVLMIPISQTVSTIRRTKFGFVR